MENIVREVLHKLIDLEPSILKRIEVTLESVLIKYEIQEKTTEIMPLENSWQNELQTFLDRKRIAGKSEKTLEQYHYNLSRALGYINKPETTMVYCTVDDETVRADHRKYLCS